jgi:hypothetical protein
MNERKRGDPNAGNPLVGQEFDVERGEIQRRGARNVFGVPDMPRDIPVGISPPEPLVVVSTFDTRPVGAYDFVLGDSGLIGVAEADVLILEVLVPNGFTAVLRRLRLEFTPNGAINLTAAGGDSLVLRLTRDGAPIPNNVFTLRGAMDLLEWPTHQVFGAGERIGVQVSGTFAVPAGDSVIVQADFLGTLIPTKGKPPETEIASPPVITRELADFKAEVQS